MNIKNIFEKSADFTIKRIIEIFGIILIIFSILLLLSFASYSPEDPNFIFNSEKEIENILGFRGSYTSDIFFQSFGLISYLIPVTLIFTGIYIFRSKKIFILLRNLFYTILYIILGSFFFSFFYKETFWLTINGNGGFVGSYLNNSFLHDLTKINQIVAYYFLVIIILLIFLISINFKLKLLPKLIISLLKLFKKKEENLINKFSKKIPILKAGNMSLGVNLLMYLTEITSKSLGKNYLSKVYEIHHKHKKKITLQELH